MKLSLIISSILASWATASYPGGQLNPNMPEDFAKNYSPSQFYTNTVKFPRMGFRSDSSSSTTLLSVDGTVVPLMGDAGWYTVTYGAQYTYANQIFALQNKQTAILEMTGCFCPGNVFQVFDNGYPILLTTNCTTPNPLDCTDRVLDPLTCSQTPSICSGAAILEPGFHNITIGVLASPWTAGAGYIRVDTACQTASPAADNPYDLPLITCCSSTACPQSIIE